MLQQLINRIRNSAALDTTSESAHEESQPIATAAIALMLEVAYADQQASSGELAKIRTIAAAHFKLASTDLDTLLSDAESLYNNSVGAQPLTRALTDSWTDAQRIRLVVALWEVALADDTIDAVEEHRIRHIADLLYVDHSDFIQAKLEAKRRPRR